MTHMTPTGEAAKPMATVALQPVSALPRPLFEPIIEQRCTQKPAQHVATFDPEKHLAFQPPSKIIMMKDIGFNEDTGVSPVAVSHPFRLFSLDAIQAMRAEIFNPKIQEKYSFSSNIAACQLRGYAKEHAPFTYEAWNHPQTLAILSHIAGVELVPEIDYEIAHINFSVKTDEQMKEELRTIDEKKRLHKEGISCPWEDDKPIVGWHTDSYPFVCVLMMSDCTNMVGGETALRTANGEIIRVRGPQEGCAVVLQGRYITHQALRALGAKERITAVTSFRPKSPFLKDDTELRTVRCISDLSELYYDFAEYRLEIMEERIRRERKDIARRRGHKKFDTLAHKEFLESSIAFLQHTNNEIVEESKVRKGYIEEVDIPDVVVEDAPQPRPTKRLRTDSAVENAIPITA